MTGDVASRPDEPHHRRDLAESFGVDAERYDRTRPSYPAELVDRILAASPGRTVLDVGCGSGIVARQFRAAGCTVLGVEPDTRMAEFARAGGLEVEVATFESWVPEGRRFDAVVAGTSWHWVDPVVGAVKAGQVLHPDGVLAPFHHVFQPPPELAGAFARAARAAAPQTPPEACDRLVRAAVAAYQPLFDKAADGIRRCGAFDEPQQWRFDWERTFTTAEWLEQLPTHGGITRLTAPQLAEVVSDVGAAIDAVGGEFTMSYATIAVVARRSSNE